MRYNPRLIKTTARVLSIALLLELVIPATRSFALTGGPSQPEVQSFEPVATTDMVDLFSGDFVYNIPLLDIEGYPINIAYHSGVGVEDEASWVGLGWNINPGVINRSVRGIPDDFSGEKIEKYLKIKPEFELSLDAGFSAELFGLDLIRAGIGNSITFNNYRGMGVGFNANLDFKFKSANTGLGISANSFRGADVDAYMNLSYAANSGNTGVTMSGQVGTGFNTRSGMRAINFGASNFTQNTKSLENKKSSPRIGVGFSSYIPIGLQNYVPAVGNASKALSLTFSAGFGYEVVGVYPHFKVAASGSIFSYEPYAGRRTYGYLNLQHADEDGLMDFSREKDGTYNRTLPNLPLSSMTYDIFSVSGQGTGGMFRPFRNDFGSVYDPKTGSSTFDGNFHFEAGIGTGFGGLFEFGVNTTYSMSDMKSGALNKKAFNDKRIRSTYEPTYFKQAGEMTSSRHKQNISTQNKSAMRVDGKFKTYNKSKTDLGQLSDVVGNVADRTTRANLLTYFTNVDAADIDQLAFHRFIKNYGKQNTFLGNTAENIGRYDANQSQMDARKKHHIGEFSQILPDGRRYVYGIPAMNRIQKEVTFSVKSKEFDDVAYRSGLITDYENSDDSKNNNSGRDKFFQMSVTPAHAHSYLLTEVLSNDYVDILGDGPTEDDLGNYTKFNYRRTSKDYRWRTPYPVSNQKAAQYDPGYYADLGDDKASYIIGSKEQWYIHSIESKNYIAEFYISSREDGKGVSSAIFSGTDAGTLGALANDIDPKFKTSSDGAEDLVQKLDSIKVYHKNDRFVNLNNAVPVKTVIFKYETTTSLQLCKGAPNVNAGKGKLTLKSISFRNGNSAISLLNPYEFEYSDNNPNYSFQAKDRWGNYQPVNPDVSAFEFPYVKQDKVQADLNARAWQLSKIKLPSKGEINITYESDDYSYVLDKPAMEMFKVAGVGNSKNFTPENSLYLDQNTIRNYVYFKRDLSREFTGRGIKETYLPNDDLLYFNFFTDISGRNRFEPVKGYAKVEEAGLCTDTMYGYFKLKLEKAGKNTSKSLHPVSLSGFNIGRMYLPHVIYPGSNDQGNINLAETVKGMQGAMQELFSIAKNPNLRFVDRGLSKYVDLNRSWIRVNTPGMSKLGGGSRVKQLTFSDSWSKMTANGTNSEIGKKYEYHIADPTTGNKISSGVANYEPQIGGDENPNRRPVPYTGEGGRLLPPVQLYQEEPLGESFFPSGSVGYSKVTVTSIHKEVGKSSKNMDEYAFYTTRDFPFYIDKTSINVDDEHKRNYLSVRSELLEVSQGFSVVLNDMHGKAKSVANYVLKGKEKELISSVKYKYKVDNSGKLDNDVKVVGRTRDPFKGKFQMENSTIGEEIDLSVDNRERVNRSLNIPVQFNLNVLNIGFVPIPVPTVFVPVRAEESTFRTSTATKIVQQYGILVATEVNDHGAITTNENLVFDGETGGVVVSKSTDQYKDPVVAINYPAMWSYPNMGGAYANVGYETDADSLYVNANGDAYIFGLKGSLIFTQGDELLVTRKNNGIPVVLWVENIEPCTGADTSSNGTGPGGPGNPGGPGSPGTPIIPPGGGGAPFWSVPPSFIGGIVPGAFGNFEVNTSVLPANPAIGIGGAYAFLEPSACCRIKVVPRMKYPSGTTLWRQPNTSTKDISIRVIRSGRKNQLQDHFMNLTTSLNFNPSNFSEFYTGNFNNLILTASTQSFSNSRTEDNFIHLPWGSQYGFNQFIRGLKGNYKVDAGYYYRADRNYSNNHSRSDGTMQTFVHTWRNPNDFVAQECTDYGFKYHSLWLGNLNWRNTNKVNVFNPLGIPIEEMDASGIKSTALFGYGHTLPIAVAQNASFRQIRYFSFEDQDRILNLVARTQGRFFESTALTNFNTTVIGNQYNRQFHKPAANSYGEGTLVINEGHTGKRSLKFTQATDLLLGRPSQLTQLTGERFYISFWTKGFAPTTGNMGIRNYTSSGSTTHHPLTLVGKPVEGWQKVEGYFYMPSVEHISLFVPVNGIVDDIRLCPAKSNMKSFAYDPLNFRLYASLDENNYATFFEYDAEGKLIRTKKETDKGILTVNESRMSNSK